MFSKFFIFFAVIVVQLKSEIQTDCVRSGLWVAPEIDAHDVGRSAVGITLGVVAPVIRQRPQVGAAHVDSRAAHLYFSQQSGGEIIAEGHVFQPQVSGILDETG